MGLTTVILNLCHLPLGLLLSLLWHLFKDFGKTSVDFDQSFKPVVPACYCLGLCEILDAIQVLGIALWRCNLKPIKFNKSLPIDFSGLQTRPQSLVIADVTTGVLFLSSTPTAGLTQGDRPRCNIACLPRISDKIFWSGTSTALDLAMQAGKCFNIQEWCKGQFLHRRLPAKRNSWFGPLKLSY